jgi:hypothetical protein
VEQYALNVPKRQGAKTLKLSKKAEKTQKKFDIGGWMW